VCSVRGLYRAFPSLDPPVYVRPQLKPSHGICSFTTTTFGAHRGDDQGAGRSTSGRDLLHLLGGSTSAPPPSTAGLLQLPGLTSTRLGRHTAVPDLHRHFRAGIFFPGPAFGFPGPALVGPGWHISVPAGIRFFWAEICHSLTGIRVCGPGWAISSLSRLACEQAGPIPAAPRLSPLLGRALASTTAGPRPGLSLIPAASRPPPRLGYASARPPLLPPGGPCPGFGRSWASAPTPLQVCQAGFPAGWAVPRRANPAWAGISLAALRLVAPAPAGQIASDPATPASVLAAPA
jgi:hypothetical protein